ncbi:grasp-with-spasm system SPASM domain peptide maturase [Chryseobacterium sp. BIGb0232]|uniref:grasp-with-spasm system SPASM domain peptide maturase n=1 Tax=Chryseobacterium sp. BIGb0232 TaxID=2940598 RepID=UPI000F492215|nr:grasp-with-spasm system SPASM domain peptide maturase [Chryseobacterium sp. BIGb0232]MCS4305353.1 SPASM domain peptide maturase of grasp-with-spasm system [Chryseobacterium sp. BIGb0232]ROS07564.1 SPASM domain peptide maturase of grasp-with-spasm system [Chryseobacterium nakagawai]
MKHFNLFSNTLITKGAGRILISDLQRNTSEVYPLEFYDVIEELKNKSIEDILSDYDDESKEIFQQYLNLLLEKEYGFITQNGWDNNFPPLSYQYNNYSSISDLFIELNDISILEKIKQSVENLGIKYLVIHSKKKITMEDFIRIDQTFASSVVSGIEIFAPYHDAVDKEFIQEINTKTSRTYNLTFYNCKKVPFKVKDEFRFIVNFTKDPIHISSCGKVDVKYFNTNITKVIEAINHNSCLHKKIGIDIHGNIKNCPLMPVNFGNINTHTLEQVVNQNDFKKLWNLTKDKIEICKDCEFRYVCTDCRAFTEQSHIDENGLDTSKPLKCGYNPYTNIWEDWSKNPLKQNAIQCYEKIGYHEGFPV